jgi:hypothetical protein
MQLINVSTVFKFAALFLTQHLAGYEARNLVSVYCNMLNKNEIFYRSTDAGLFYKNATLAARPTFSELKQRLKVMQLDGFC